MTTDTVCPNCISPYKCNGPHIYHITNKVYRCDYGYFIFRDETSKWIFTPSERDFDTDMLLSVMDTLRNLNESQTINFSQSHRS
jgi:hypothetical protein